MIHVKLRLVLHDLYCWHSKWSVYVCMRDGTVNHFIYTCSVRKITFVIGHERKSTTSSISLSLAWWWAHRCSAKRGLMFHLSWATLSPHTRHFLPPTQPQNIENSIHTTQLKTDFVDYRILLPTLYTTIYSEFHAQNIFEETLTVSHEHSLLYSILSGYEVILSNQERAVQFGNDLILTRVSKVSWKDTCTQNYWRAGVSRVNVIFLYIYIFVMGTVHTVMLYMLLICVHTLCSPTMCNIQIVTAILIPRYEKKE